MKHCKFKVNTSLLARCKQIKQALIVDFPLKPRLGTHTVHKLSFHLRVHLWWLLHCTFFLTKAAFWISEEVWWQKMLLFKSIKLLTWKVFGKLLQGLTIGAHCSYTYTYFYWHAHDFGHVSVDLYAYFYPMIFYSFQNFSGYDLILFKNLLLYIWTFIYLFVLGRDRFFTVCICFKEILSFNFSYKLFTKHFFFHQSTCQFRVSVRK